MTYQVTISNTGTRFLVENDERILAAAIRQGIGLPYGCRNGECGSCKGQINSGKVHYQTPHPALTPAEEQHGKALFCQAYALSDLEIVVNELTRSADVPLKRFPAKVAEMHKLSHDVMQVVLKLPPAMRFQFFAGQYIDFILKDGRRRSFSIANAPHVDGIIELHVRHVQGGQFTGEIFDHMRIDDVVRLEGPLGSFYLREDSKRPVILLAGGTGFAPINGILEHVLRKKIQRPFHLYWGARSFADLYMHEKAEQWAAQHKHLHYTPVLSDPDDNWTGRRGYLQDAVLQDFTDLTGYEVYASGPPAMVYAGRDAFVPHGIDPQHYYSDAFEFSND
jgi:CDP-4-dehydro-6-deoxyglucose reductase